MQLCNLGTSKQFRNGRNMALTFAATHEQQFSLLQNYGIGDLSYWNEHTNFYFRRALCGVALTCWRTKLREVSFVWVRETTLGRSPIPLEWGSGRGSSRVLRTQSLLYTATEFFRSSHAWGKVRECAGELCWKVKVLQRNESEQFKFGMTSDISFVT